MGAGRGERQDRTGLFGIAKDGDARNSGESGPRVAAKRGLVGRDTRTSHTLDIVERSDKSDRFENWGRSGFELVRRGRIFDVIATYCCDHLAAAEHWRHALEPAWLGIESPNRSEEHTSALQSLMRISYAVFCLKKKNEK